MSKLRFCQYVSYIKTKPVLVLARARIAACQERPAFGRQLVRGFFERSSSIHQFESSAAQQPFVEFTLKTGSWCVGSAVRIFVHAQIVYLLEISEEKLFRCGVAYI